MARSALQILSPCYSDTIIQPPTGWIGCAYLKMKIPKAPDRLYLLSRIEIAVSALRPQTSWIPEKLQKFRCLAGVAALPPCNYPTYLPRFFLASCLRSFFLSSHFPYPSLLLLTIVLHLCGRNMPIFCRRNRAKLHNMNSIRCVNAFENNISKVWGELVVFFRFDNLQNSQGSRLKIVATWMATVIPKYFCLS